MPAATVALRLQPIRATLARWVQGVLGTAVGVCWANQPAARPERPYVELNLAGGFRARGLDEVLPPRLAPSSAACTVLAAVEGLEYLLRVNEGITRYRAPAGATRTTIRDALIAASIAAWPGYPPPTAGAGEGELVVHPDGLGDLGSVELLPTSWAPVGEEPEPTAATVLGPTTLVRESVGDREARLSINVYSAEAVGDDTAEELATTLSSSLMSPPDRALYLYSRGVSIWGTPSTVRDLSAEIGGLREQRAQFDVRIASRSRLIRSTTTLEAVLVVGLANGREVTRLVGTPS